MATKEKMMNEIVASLSVEAKQFLEAMMNSQFNQE